MGQFYARLGSEGRGSSLSPRDLEQPVELSAAIKILQQYIKESAIPGQRHISPDLVNASDLPTYQQALEVTNKAVLQGELSREQLLHQLGLSR